MKVLTKDGKPIIVDGKMITVEDIDVGEAVNDYLNENPISAEDTVARGEVSRLSESIDEISDTIFKKESIIDFERVYVRVGYAMSSTGLDSARASSVVTTSFIPVKKDYEFSVSSDVYAFQICEYDDKSENTFTSYSGVLQYGSKYVVKKDGYVRISVRNADGTNATKDTLRGIVSPTINISVIEDIKESLDSVKEDIIMVKDNIMVKTPVNVNSFVVGRGLNSNGTTSTKNYACVLGKKYLCDKGSTISVKNNSSVLFAVAQFFDKSDASLIKYTSYSNNTFTIDSDCYILVSVKYEDQRVLSNADIFNEIVFGLYNFSPMSETVESLFYVSEYDKTGELCFGNIPHGFYNGLQSEYNLFSKSTTVADIYSLFDNLMNNSNGYITKNNIGTSVNGKAINEYVLKSKSMTIPPVGKGKTPKILIDASIQGDERSSTWGLYYFAKDLCENWLESPILDYIRNHIELHFVPVVCPDGYDASTYVNANAVNINRNFDTSKWTYVDPSDRDNYAGSHAGDQPETIAVQNWILSNRDALFFIDFHTNGNGIISRWDNVNWINLINTDDEYYNKFVEAVKYHVENISAHFEQKYNTQNGDVMLARMTRSSDTSTAKQYAFENGVLSTTFEGFNGFPTDSSRFSENVQKANSELICNFILSIIETIKA